MAFFGARTGRPQRVRSNHRARRAAGLTTSPGYRSIRWLPAAHLLLAAALVLSAAGVLRAQGRNLKFDRITSAQGLSDNYVMCATEDRRGFLWFGTRDGLNRYDGTTVTVFRHDPDDSTTLPDGSVKCLFEDREGTLWIGTHAGGLARYDREHERFERMAYDPRNPFSIAEGPITGIAEDDAGNLWVSVLTHDAGVCVLDRSTGRFQRLRHDPRDRTSLSSNNVTSVCRDSSGTIWVGTSDGGINRWSPTLCGFINRATTPLLDVTLDPEITVLSADGTGTIWAQANDAMLMITSDGSFLSRHRAPARRRDAQGARAVLRDRDGRVWLGSKAGGLEEIDPDGSTWRTTHDPADRFSLASNLVFCIMEDRAGNLWVGTDNGISKLNRRCWQFQYYQHDASDSSTIGAGVVRAIFGDVPDELWVGTAGSGLDRIDARGRRAVHYRGPSDATGLSDGTVNTIMRDRRGRIWIGTNGGLNLFDSVHGTFRRFAQVLNDSTTLPHGGVWAVLDNDDGTVWVATLGGGLALLDPATGRARRLTHRSDDPSSICNDRVVALFRDHAGRLWVGTDAGLARYDDATGRFTCYANDPHDSTSLSNDRVWDIHEDRQGMLWLATSGGGVNRFDPRTGRCRRYMEKQGLVSNTACAIVEDAHGILWVSTNNGISRIDPATDDIRNYTAGDGLFITVFHFKASHIDAQGNISFGGNEGIMRFNPDSLTDNPHIPQVSITALMSLGQPVPTDASIMTKRSIALDHRNNFFTIEFSALDPTNAGRNRFRYRLDGYDETWHTTTGARPYAEYTDVPPGHYRFEVAAANNDGAWSHVPAALGIEIVPAFWQTWWFLALAIACAVALVAAALVARIRSVRRAERRDRKVVEYQLQALRAQMNPHFIFNSLNSILHFIVGHDSVSAHRYLATFSRLIRMTLQNSTRDAVPLAEELEGLRLYLELESLRFDHHFDYEIRVADGINAGIVLVPPMLMQPYVENAIKHGLADRAHNATVIIDVAREGDMLRCTITDNGIGRARAAALDMRQLSEHRAYGMQMTRNRLDVLSTLHRQRYAVDIVDLADDRGAAAGTRVELLIPLTA